MALSTREKGETGVRKRTPGQASHGMDMTGIHQSDSDTNTHQPEIRHELLKYR